MPSPREPQIGIPEVVGMTSAPLLEGIGVGRVRVGNPNLLVFINEIVDVVAQMDDEIEVASIRDALVSVEPT